MGEYDDLEEIPLLSQNQTMRMRNLTPGQRTRTDRMRDTALKVRAEKSTKLRRPPITLAKI
jgi:hypothetical protein